MPPPGGCALEVLEVAHDLPAIEARIADVDARLARARSTPPQHAAEASTRGPGGGARPGAPAAHAPPAPAPGRRAPAEAALGLESPGGQGPQQRGRIERMPPVLRFLRPR